MNPSEPPVSLPPADSLVAELQENLLRIARLLQRRAQVIEQARQAGIDLREREAEWNVVDLATINRAAPPFPAESAAAVLREISAASRTLIRPTRVAFLGPEWSYSHLAALQAFGHSVELIPVGSIGATFEAVERGDADFGLAPLENSTDGGIVDTLDVLARKPQSICGEVTVPIRHCLFSKSPRAEIREVYSKPQALSQCRRWLAENLPWARAIEFSSTAEAVRLAGEKPGAAAVASRESGMAYDVPLVAEGIEDQKDNATRFAVIGSEPTAPSGDDKTALRLRVAHVPGALADATAIFRDFQCNLNWIESFPMPGSRSEYLFFIEFEGHRDEPRVRQMLEALGRSTQDLLVLGSFPRRDWRKPANGA
jgi:chorismate mutase/prephenate dehydratase